MYFITVKFGQWSPSVWLLYPSDVSPLIFKYFLILYYRKILKLTFIFPAPDLESVIFPRSPGSF